MTTEQKQRVGGAVASLVLGILGLILIGPLGSIPAVICGHVATSKIKKNPGVFAGDGMALAGLILGYLQIGLMVIMLPLMAAIAIPSFVRARDMAQNISCINNMRMLAVAKEKAAMGHDYRDGATVSENQVSEYLENGFSGLVCPKGGRYTINPLGQDLACSEHGTLSEATDRR